MSEAPFSINVSPGRTPQVTVRGTTFNEFSSHLEELSNDPLFPDHVAAFCEAVNAGFASAELTKPTAASTPAGAPAAKAASAVGAPSMFTYTDKDGSTWTFEHPSAPALPDGRPYKYAIKEGTNKAGKPYKGLFDPAKAYPQPPEFQFTRGGDISPIFKHEVL